MTRAELRERMSAKEFGEWMTYYSISPFGEKREDFRAGLICQVLAEIHRDSNKRHTAFEIEQFLLKFEIDNMPRLATLADAERLHAAFQAFSEGEKVVGAFRMKPKKPS